MVLLELLVERLYGFVGCSGWNSLWFCRRFWLRDFMVLLKVLVERFYGFVRGAGCKIQ